MNENLTIYAKHPNILFHNETRDFLNVDTIKKFDTNVLFLKDEEEDSIYIGFDYGFDKNKSGSPLILNEQKQLISTFSSNFRNILENGNYYKIETTVKIYHQGIEYYLLIKLEK